MIAFANRVTVQQDISVAGSQRNHWQDFRRSVPCEIKQISGDETYAGRKLETHVDYVVKMRAAITQDIDSTMRLLVVAGTWSGRIFHVREARYFPKDKTRAAMWELYCSEKGSTVRS